MNNYIFLKQGKVKRIISFVLILLLVVSNSSIAFAQRNGKGGNEFAGSGKQSEPKIELSQDVILNEPEESATNQNNDAYETSTEPVPLEDPEDPEDLVDPIEFSSSNTETTEKKENPLGIDQNINGGKKSSGKENFDSPSTEKSDTDEIKIGGGSTGMNITVVVEGIAEEVLVSIVREEEGAITVFQSMTFNHIARFSVPLGGTCKISSSEVSGYKTPLEIVVPLTQTKGNFNITKTLVYEEGVIAVEGLDLETTDLSLFIGESKVIKGFVKPANANNQVIHWISGNASVATVNEFGEVLGVAIGETTITATTDDGSYSKFCTVTVDAILSINEPSEIEAFTGELITLPPMVTAITTRGEMSIAVNWNGSSWLNGNQVVLYNMPNPYGQPYELVGEISGSDLSVFLRINVTGFEVPKVTHIELDHYNLGIYTGNQVLLTIIDSIPSNVDLSSLVWSSNNPSIANVSSMSLQGDSATITGISPGTTLIQVKTWDGVFLDACFVNVASNPELVDFVRIIATTEDSSNPVDQFENIDQVYIRGYNLPVGTYHLKIEEKGKNSVLGESIEGTHVVITEVTPEYKFKLLDAVHFELGDNFSKSYFVSMSLDDGYPRGDYEDGTPKTLVDNFKIGSPVPTGKITVDVNQEYDYGNGPIEVKLKGTRVFLARELSGQTAFETELEDYKNPYYLEEGQNEYTDEIKMFGQFDEFGHVVWDEPRESLKIGGYILLFDLPNGYRSNINEVNPFSEDGELLKEVHIIRDSDVHRQITVQKENAYLDNQNLSIFVGNSTTLNLMSENPTPGELVWSSENPNIALVTKDPVNEGSAVVTAVAPGVARISLRNGNGVLAFCLVNVTLDPSLTDPAYIIATTNDSPDSVDQFKYKEDVFIRAYGLPAGDYHIKIEDKGTAPLLGESTETFTVFENEDVIFNLNEIAPFKLSDSFSASYFVSMSLDDSYPTGDDESGLPRTFTDNFKIGSPVPTGFIEIELNQLNDGEFGLVDEGMIGKDVILAREIGKSALDTQYEDYMNPLFENHPELSRYTDEVKLIGHIQINNDDPDHPYNYVEWDVPKEKLKIGGYILLMELPKDHSYVTNLDMVNPLGEDGELLKEVHIKRDENVYRLITIQNLD